MKKELHCGFGYGKLAIARTEDSRPNRVTMRNLSFGSLLLLFFLLLFPIGKMNAQNYNMSNADVTTCSGNFYDSNGSGLTGSGRYQNNETYSKTFTPATPGNKIKVIFTTFATEANFDGLMIYNGSDTSAPLISSGAPAGDDPTTCPAGAFSGSDSPGTVISTAADGSLTFVFRSDTGTRAGGWISTVSCEAPATTEPACASGFSPSNGATGVLRNASLSWNAVSGATSYNVFAGTSPTPPLQANVTATTYTPPAVLAANTTYYYKIVPTNEFGDAIGCATMSFTTGTDFTYCQPTYGNGCALGDSITKVVLGTLSNTSGCAGGDHYTFYDNVTVPNAGQGANVNIKITLGSDTNGQYAAAWIDFNQNGSFEASEGGISGDADAGGTVTITLPVPADAELGNTRMRIRGGNDSALTTSQACGTSSGTYGESEDYIVNIIEPLPPTSCVTLTSPIDNAAEVPAPGNEVTLSWTASADEPVATSYDVYFGADADEMELLGNTGATSVNITGVDYGTQYYWSIVAKSDTGSDAAGCQVFSFTTENPFTPYCSDIGYETDVEPITSVNFAGIINTTDNTVNGSPALENFTDVIGNVTTENTYTMHIRGNTAGNYTTNLRVFIDWNQDGDFGDANESYDAGSLTNSTGIDAIEVVTDITVPGGALAGLTRMRVKKLYSGDDGSITEPCAGGEYGQTEDYSLEVTLCTPVTWYADADGDGYGNPSDSVSACLQPDGYVADGTDCNDLDDAAYQSAMFYIDNDGDGYDAGQQTVCYGASVPAGYSAVTNGSDCNDNDASAHQTFTFYVDADGDGWGSTAEDLCAATGDVAPAGYSMTGSDCDDNLETVHPNATEIGYNLIDDDCDGSVDEGFPPKVTYIQSAMCDITLPQIDSQLIANLVAGAQGYQWRITALTGSHAGQVQLLDTPIRAMKLTQLADYAFGTEYQVEVAVYYAGFLQPFTPSGCTVTTPAPMTSIIACGETLSTMSDAIYTAIVPHATGYRFKITDPANPTNTQEITRNTRDFRLNTVTAFDIDFGKTYRIEVAVRNTDGSYLPYGPACELTTPIFPTTSLQDSQCDNFLVPENQTPLYADSYPGAIRYAFLVTGVGLPAGGVEIVRNTRTFTLQQIDGIIPGATYNVKVRLIFDENDPAGPYGKTCTVIAPGLAKSVTAEKNPITATIYPNPYSEGFSIRLSDGVKDAVSVKVYDMTGRLLESFTATGAELMDRKIGNGYPSGIYNVIVDFDNETASLRAIKR